MFIASELAQTMLRRFPTPPSWRTRLGDAPAPQPGKLEAYFGEQVWADFAGRTVIDFGCRTGADSLEMARRGAAHVIGLDIVPEALAVAARAAAAAGLSQRCTFATTTTTRADRILCIDAFEHFRDPAGVLRTMAELLAPGGAVWASFGPPWLHPRGGHSFSVFPWAHLVFSETALLRWRSRFRDDGARRFEEVDGGLNRMTLGRFERLVRDSPLRFASFEAVPIRAARWFHHSLTREVFTSMVRCRLIHKGAAQQQQGRAA